MFTLNSRMDWAERLRNYSTGLPMPEGNTPSILVKATSPQAQFPQPSETPALPGYRPVGLAAANMKQHSYSVQK